MAVHVFASLFVVLLLAAVLIWIVQALTDGAVRAAEDLNGLDSGDMGRDDLKDGVALAFMFVWLFIWKQLKRILEKLCLLRLQ